MADRTIQFTCAMLPFLLIAVFRPALAQQSTSPGMTWERLTAHLVQQRIEYVQEVAAGPGQAIKLKARYQRVFRGMLCSGVVGINPTHETTCDCEVTYLSEDGQTVTSMLNDLRLACLPAPTHFLRPN